ncbi:gamma-glutamyltransferase [candidate division KSB1 bacterium]
MKNFFIKRNTLLILGIFCIFLTITACFKKPFRETNFKNGLVVSTQQIASQVGADILKKGGNAVDAAVAVSYALAVVHPTAGNIGGGGFMVIRKSNGDATTIDYREKAPGKAHRDMYLDEDGNVNGDLSTVGALAAGIPGTVAGTLYALEKYGTMNRKEVIQSAVDLAENGWVLNYSMGGERFKLFPSTNAVFNKPDGSQYEAGELFKQKELAKTLRIISEKGHDGFYRGKVADLIVNTMERYGGLITHEDLTSYQAVERPPVTGTYRGFGIASMSPPSSGGICLIQLLNILEPYNIGSLGWNTPETVHLVVEAERRVYADRSEFLGDSDFVHIPVGKLISKEYADIRAKNINPFRATLSDEVTYGDLAQLRYESEETTHYSVVDKDSMAVAVTTTLNGGYGSYLVVEGAGFLLNNEMDDFSSKPGTPNMFGLLGNEANAIEPNKRMLSSMTPTIITKEGKNYMVIGTPGGSTIITTVLQCIMNVIDHGMSIREAVSAARFHHQWYPDNIQHEEDAFSNETIAKLKELGHTLSVRKIGDANGIIIDPKSGLYMGGADPRSRLGAAVGY